PSPRAAPSPPGRARRRRRGRSPGGPTPEEESEERAAPPYKDGSVPKKPSQVPSSPPHRAVESPAALATPARGGSALVTAPDHPRRERLPKRSGPFHHLGFVEPIRV